MSQKDELVLFSPNNHSQYQIGWEYVSSSVSDACGFVLSKHYRMSLLQIMQVKEWERQSNNFRVLVLTQQGNYEWYLLRKHIKWNNRQDVEDVDRIMTYLLGAGLPVPRLVLATNGENFAQEGGHLWQVYEFLDGDHYHGTEHELKDIATNIATMHRMLAAAPFVEEVKRKSQPRTPWTKEVWHDMLFRSQRRESWVDLLLDDNRELVLGAMDAVESHRVRMAASPKQIIHRDLHPWNTLYKNEELQAIIDFSDAHFGELLRDAAYACHRFVRQFAVCAVTSEWQDVVSRGVGLFVDAYSRVNSVIQGLNDMEVVAAFMQDELLTKTLDNARDWYVKGTDKTVKDGELKKKLTLLGEASVIGEVLKKL